MDEEFKGLVKKIKEKFKKEVRPITEKMTCYTPRKIRINPNYTENGVFDTLEIEYPECICCNEELGNRASAKESKIIKEEIINFAKENKLHFLVTKSIDYAGYYSPFRGFHGYLWFNKFPKSFNRTLYLFFIEKGGIKEIEKVMDKLKS